MVKFYVNTARVKRGTSEFALGLSKHNLVAYEQRGPLRNYHQVDVKFYVTLAVISLSFGIILRKEIK